MAKPNDRWQSILISRDQDLVYSIDYGGNDSLGVRSQLCLRRPVESDFVVQRNGQASQSA